MMYYTTTNQPKHIKTSLLDRCISFACEYLHLDVDFEIYFERLDQFQCGFCSYEEDEILIVVSKTLSENDVIRTIFHEMVHIKQYVEGRLEVGSPQRWLGKVYDWDYENMPWEVEAFDLEQKMVDIYSESL